MSQLLKSAGVFKARIIQHAVTESRQQGLPQYAIKAGCYEMEQHLTNADGSQQLDKGGRPIVGFVPLDDEYTLQDYLPLAWMKDGVPTFTNTFDNIQEALGWHPDPNRLWESLQEHPIAELSIQVVVEVETYEGKERAQIKFINPIGFAGMGIREMDAPALAKLSNAWAATFRAKFGSGGGAAAPALAPAAAPAPAQPAPAAQAAPATPQPAQPAQAAPAAPQPAAAAAPAPVAQAPAPAPAAAATPSPSTPPASPAASGAAPAAPGSTPSSKEEVWALCVQDRGNMTDEALGQEFFSQVESATGAKTSEQVNALTPEQWGTVRAQIERDGLIPF